MKPKLLPLSAAIVLLVSAASYAGNGYFTALGRNIGYGIGDGYHVHRSCLAGDASYGDCSPVQQPMMQQPMMPQPMMPQPEMLPPLEQAMTAPAYSPWAAPQFEQASYPVDYPATQAFQPWYERYAPGDARPVAPAAGYFRPR